MSTSVIFSDIIGHEPILRVLTHALAKPAYAYLFCGPRGVGKGAVAKRFASALLNLHPLSFRAESYVAEESLAATHANDNTLLSHDKGSFTASDSVQDDGGGKGIELKTHPDFIRTLREEGAREIVVKQARELITRMQLTSARGGYKVALIEEADRLNEEAANALLKAVEEPSANTVYIFIAEQPDRIPATLRSRLVKMEFGRVKTEVIEKWLSQTQPPPPPLSGGNSDSHPTLIRGVGGLASAPPDKGGGGVSVRAIAEQSRGCPGTAFRLAFDKDEAWFDALDWQAITQTLLTSPTGQKLQTIEKLTQTIDSQPDPETAWREALDRLMRALDHCFVDEPKAATNLGQGLAHAWKLVGGAIPPRLAIEYAILPEEAKQGRMIPRILS